MCDFFGQRANRGQLAQSQLLPLCRLFQIGGELLEHTQLLTEKRCWEELSLAHFPDSAVTDEVTQAKDISDNCLIVSLAEHESNEFAHGCKEHEDVTSCLSLIQEPSSVLTFCELLCHIGCHLVLIRDIKIVVLATNVMHRHDRTMSIFILLSKSSTNRPWGFGVLGFWGFGFRV